MSVAIIDYGLGNLASVAGAVERLGHSPVISADPAVLADAERLILPGVGAFPDGMANLKERGLIEVLNRLVLGQGVPLLGICLGFQLLARNSLEFTDTQGLGWIEATVRPLAPDDPTLRLPHVGWNEITPTRDHPLLAGIASGALVYFVHHYHMVVDDPEVVLATTDYGGPVTAAVARGPVLGTQFHPEKSQQEGLTVLGNFLGPGER